MKKTTENKYFDYWLSNEYCKTPRHYRALNFYLNTFCNKRCPECAVHIPKIKSPENYSIEYIEHAASHFFGIEHVSITGGEPLLHPQFKKIAPYLKKWFGCGSLTLESNGYNFKRYKGLMKYFDDVMISHYPDNQDMVSLAKKMGHDGRPDGQTLHVTTARRARRPSICRRANFLMYVYGRVYPCACVPSGYASLGIPLTENWRQEIAEVPMPCAECCFAEEAADETTVVPAIDKDLLSMHRSSVNYPSVREESRWPELRDDIKIYGLELDSWMAHEAIIHINQPAGEKVLRIHFESHIPEEYHPLTLSFMDSRNDSIDSFIIRSQGSSWMRLDLSKYIVGHDESRITMHCDKVYTGSGRGLGVRVCSLIYEEK